MSKAKNTPDWVARFERLLRAGCEKYDYFTEITGAQWRDFYQNHWPDEFYIDHFRIEFEDEVGNYILSDDARHTFDVFGYAVVQQPVRGSTLPGLKETGTMFPIHILYEAIMLSNKEKAMSKGEYRVGVSFNPSGDLWVDEIKVSAAELIDLIEDIPDLEMTERKRLKALAQTEVESAAMWAVKAATKKPEG